MTTLRAGFLASSHLRDQVRNGLQALAKAHVRDLIDEPIRGTFDDSLDLDDATKPGHETEHRWDYLLGHGASKKVVALEPHTATNHEVSVVIKKREAALVHLRGQLKAGVAVSRWYWVASGSVDFLPMDKKVLTLTQSGITFVGRKLRKKHLP